jgi:hypothetical protein
LVWLTFVLSSSVAVELVVLETAMKVVVVVEPEVSSVCLQRSLAAGHTKLRLALAEHPRAWLPNQAAMVEVLSLSARQQVAVVAVAVAPTQVQMVHLVVEEAAVADPSQVVLPSVQASEMPVALELGLMEIVEMRAVVVALDPLELLAAPAPWAPEVLGSPRTLQEPLSSTQSVAREPEEAESRRSQATLRWTEAMVGEAWIPMDQPLSRSREVPAALVL